MARQRGERIKVHVKLGNLKYGFLTQKKGSEQHKAVLGHTAFNGAAGVFFGANSPKPPRATYTGKADTFSSFCGTDKVDTIRKTTGWNVQSNSRRRGLKTSGLTRTVYVEMPGGWKYAWNITASDVDLKNDLGFALATPADVGELIWGVDSPKPPRATRKNGTNETESSFIKPQASVMDAAAGKGWTVSGVDYDLIPNA